MSKKFLHILPFTICCIMGLTCKGAGPDDNPFCPKNGKAQVKVLYGGNHTVYMGYNGCDGKYHTHAVSKLVTQPYDVVPGQVFHLGLKSPQPFIINDSVEKGTLRIYTCSTSENKHKEPVLQCTVKVVPAIIQPIK